MIVVAAARPCFKPLRLEILRPDSDRAPQDLAAFRRFESILHCEVKADHAAAARDHVKRIPNLMEWREVSFAELLELAKNRI